MQIRRLVTRYVHSAVAETVSTYDARKPVRCADDLATLFRAFLGHETVEVFAAVLLDSKSRPMSIAEVSRGTLNSSLVHPREVFGPAIREGAATIVVSHNHPSGDPKPSREDMKITRRLAQAGNLLGIQLLDHVVIGEDSHVSLRALDSSLFA